MAGILGFLLMSAVITSTGYVLMKLKAPIGLWP
jgi:hypothetical protein